VILLSDQLEERLSRPYWTAVLEYWYNMRRKIWTDFSLELEVEVLMPIFD